MRQNICIEVLSGRLAPAAEHSQKGQYNAIVIITIVILIVITVSQLLLGADLLEHALVRDGTAELHVAALQALLETAEDNYASFAKRYVTRISWLKSFLGHTVDEGEP